LGIGFAPEERDVYRCQRRKEPRSVRSDIKYAGALDPVATARGSDTSGQMTNEKSQMENTVDRAAAAHDAT
jgi:hypothetical protein